MKISVFGLGYVGLSNALLLGQHEDVMAYDIVDSKIEQLSQGKATLDDKEIIEFLASDHINVKFTSDFERTVNHGDYLIIATPTDYNEETQHFDTSTIENVIERALTIRKDATFLIKSTIPVNYVQGLKEKYGTENIIFSPEFLREGRALYDNLYPSRIVIGEVSKRGEELAAMFKRGAHKEDVATLLMNETEAEAVKLFSNTYLALRVAYFNELDTYAETNGLNTKKIIEGMGFDPRIGNYYNNPSFGYGGYCLPKDTKQVKAEFYGVPQEMMTAVVGANTTRKEFIAQQILAKNPKVVGIYRLTMKAGSDNFRYSAIHDIIRILEDSGAQVLIYEPRLPESVYHGISVEKDFETFNELTDIIVANRMDEILHSVQDKVYTRDLYERD
ncbi:nucleotide sugar dehydrogenase [Lactococcus garvieae]|jgi:UDPglucose 6-dehydrogenase|uniref:UDP-glucose 6-dehydrogenase n=1 Tax=Lactococcus garvieae TaxID=1363 RepID=A0AA46TVQ8_9LACT|nr:nucleotide sugar dehydrogenase [Lactococcus garvieae]UYT10509.1 nucleotide sugar dehydrogenase [Lactococcus garvieae]UYT12550.1 nucleotide sugar dehydrogenase [Lactococcus garvieae]